MPVDRLVVLLRDRLPAGETIGIAISGGGDSTALLHLARAAGLRVEAVTVDHRLRVESAAEAAGVAAACAASGVPHAVRVWEHGPIAGNLMDAARQARMRLILDWAAERAIRHVALGHTRDDQAETFLMGLARGAGLTGLSGMRHTWEDQGVRLYRPLLDAGRAELRDWLRGRGIPWVEDPTNEDIRFSRVKARAALAALSPLGITGERLAAAAGHLASAQEVVAAGVASAAARHVVRTAGALRVSPTLADEPMEVRRLLMMRAVHWLSGERYPPRSDDLARFSGAVLAGRAATLAGVRTKAGWMMREPRAVGQPVTVDRLWDRRWRVTGPPGEVRALGAEGLRQCPDWRSVGLPREVLAVTPGVWHGETLVSAPLAGWENGWSAQLDAPDHLFGLSD